MDDEILEAVAPDGAPLGVVGRTEAHTAPGVLHRAFSVVLADDRGRVLLQQRHHGKPTFGGCWSNSVCSHPYPGEALADAAVRGLRRELGVEERPVEVGRFIYRAVDPRSGLAEAELDHVMVARVPADLALHPDPAEIDDLAWLEPGEVDAWIADPEVATSPWLPLVHQISRSYLAATAPEDA